MATLDLDDNQANFQIRAYKPGSIQVNETLFTQSIIVTPSQLIADWAPQEVGALTAESFVNIIALKPDVLLIGTGASLVFIPVELYGELVNHGIGVEVMDTRAACRTFNALASENRNVAAALIIA